MNPGTTADLWPQRLEGVSDPQLSAFLKANFSRFLNRKFAGLDLEQQALAKRTFTGIFAQLDWKFLRDYAPVDAMTALARVALEVFLRFCSALDPKHRGVDHPLWEQIQQKLATGFDEVQVSQVNSREALLDLYRELAALAKTHREAHEVVCLRFLMGMTMAEVGEALKLSLQNVRTLEKRGLQVLKAAM